MRKILFIAVALCFVITGCKNNKSLLPNVSGHAGEVLIVMENQYWDANPGSILRDSLKAECKYLPQREPMYNVINVTPINFNPMFQIHRNIILVNINSDISAPGIVCKYDRWATPQIVMYVNANTMENAEELLKTNMHSIINAIEQTERQRVIDNTRKYQEQELAKTVQEYTGGSMLFPSGWSLKKKTDNFLWFSYETTYYQQGVFVYKYSVTDAKKQLSRDGLIKTRNLALMNNVPGMVDGSYMITSESVVPGTKYVEWKGNKFAELKGLWDVQGDFMGGPFVSHTFFTPDKSELVCIDGYVYAPKYDKRHYMRQVESLLYSFEWPADEE